MRRLQGTRVRSPQLPGVSVQRRVQERTTKVGVPRPAQCPARRKKGHPKVQDMQMMPNRLRVLGRKGRTGRGGWGVRRKMGGRSIEEDELKRGRKRRRERGGGVGGGGRGGGGGH